MLYRRLFGTMKVQQVVWFIAGECLPCTALVPIEMWNKRAARHGDITFMAKEAANEIEQLRALLEEVISGDWTDAAYVTELPSRLAESGWFKRASAALTKDER